MRLRHAEGGEIFHDGAKLGKAGVELLVSALVAGQGGENLLVAAADGDEAQDLVRRIQAHADLVR